ncbi:MAG: hypothetical protein FWE27_00375 [Defluviitaleaceae bacterium]|nr:hypothetical protein [Defluviitaleaceae bacterium]
MERYKTRNLDITGRLSIPGELRIALNIEAGSNIFLTCIDTIVAIHRAEGDAGTACAVSHINDTGMISLPAEVKKKMGWKEKARIAMYHTDKLIILKSA